MDNPLGLILFSVMTVTIFLIYVGIGIALIGTIVYSVIYYSRKLLKRS